MSLTNRGIRVIGADFFTQMNERTMSIVVYIKIRMDALP